MDESREMITRGRISGGVMHDVKNMVQNLSGNVQCMQLKSPNDNMRVRLDMMSRQIGEMSQLVNSYLQMGKESMSSLDCSVNALLSQTVGLMSGTLGMNRIEIFTDLAEDLPELCVDGTRLKQVFMNCLENSLDAIVERRRNIDPKEKFYGEVWVRSCGSEGGGIDIIIEDNGVGLTEEQERRFFEPFFTTKQGGHGIGASFSRAVVELHGGVMRANNRPEGGCRVVIALPAVTKLSGRKINLYDELAELNW